MSFVWGDENVSFLSKRFKAMAAHHCYHGMEYTEDRKQIADWVPLVMEGRTGDDPVAATRIVTGTDVDYGSLTNHFVNHLSALPGFAVHYLSRVTGLSREQDGRWRVEIEDAKSGDRRSVTAKFVFIGAGGGALPLLQKSGIPEGKGYAGFPVGGIWLRCDDPAINKRHHAKVYGKAPSRIAAHVGAAPRHSGDRRAALAAVRAVCRLLNQIPETWLPAGFGRVSQARQRQDRCFLLRATMSILQNI